MKRLKNQEQFQGARYELFVASTFIKAGFEIHYENESDPSRKHPEFVATHPQMGIKLAVEAKSRHRPGVLHQPGERSTETIAGVKTLLWKAFEKLDQLPYAIFIDLNLPPSDQQIFETEWFKEVAATLAQMLERHRYQHNPYNFIFFTSYPYHYVGTYEPAPEGDCFGTIASNPRIKKDCSKVFDMLMDVLQRYVWIPNKFEDAD